MRGSSHIQSVLIGIKYRNCCQTLHVYLPFFRNEVNLIKTDLYICNLWTGQFASYKSVIYLWFNLPKQNVNKHPKFEANFDIRRQLDYFEYEMIHS